MVPTLSSVVSSDPLRRPKKLFARNEHGASLTVSLEGSIYQLRLPTGELEVLATSLLDEQAFLTEEFLQDYHRRWGI